MKDVHYVTYEDSVEQNLMALVLTKERLNEFIKTGEVKEQSEIFEEFDVTMSVIDSLLVSTRTTKAKYTSAGEASEYELNNGKPYEKNREFHSHRQR